MKHAKKLASLLLALIMVLSMTVTAFAAGEAGDQTGSITIKDSDTVSVAGKTFNAYKILDVTALSGTGDAAKVVYSVPTEMKDFYNERYGLNGDEVNYNDQVVDHIRKESDMSAFAAAALAVAEKTNPTGTAAAGAGATSVKIGDLPLGYYVVKDTGAKKPVSALILDTTNKDPEVTIKADQPTIDKNIVETTTTTEGDKKTTKVKYNTSSVGDKVPYELTSKVPDMTGYKHYYFVVNDTLSKGLKFNNDVEITIDGVKLAKDAFTVTPDPDPSTGTGETKVKIVFKSFYDNYKDKAGKDIIITYSATVTKDAEIGVAGNPNKVTLTYSNNPNTVESGTPGEDEPGTDSPTGTTAEVETRTYVTGVKLIKVDPNGNNLTGAEFEITGTKVNTVLVTGEEFVEDPTGEYWKLKDGTYTKDDPNAENMDQTKYESTTIRYAKKTLTKAEVKPAESVNVKAYVGANGELQFDGLAAGDYVITELKAPNGYNLLEKPINLKITCTLPEKDATSKDCTWGYEWKQDGKTMTAEAGVGNIIKVVNYTGTKLPSTGGMGTTIFYVVGSILLIGAAVLLVTKKRMSNMK